jgi:hypothetical protein
VEGSVASGTEKETAHRAGAGDVGTLTILGTFPLTEWRKDDGDKLGLTGRDPTERFGLLVSTPASHSGGPGFKSRPIDRLSSIYRISSRDHTFVTKHLTRYEINNSKYNIHNNLDITFG